MVSDISSDTLAEWVSRLVRIPSVNPDQAGPKAGVSGELALAEAVAGWLATFGGEVFLDEVEPGRPNVMGLFEGSSQRWVGVDVHLDTVAVENMSRNPFDGVIENSRVYGRGAVDTKATLGIMLALLERASISGARPVPNLLLAGTVAEETGGQAGARALASWLGERGLTLDQLVVGEPTECRPVHAHKGFLALSVAVHGVAVHTSIPDDGRNAVVGAAKVVLALREEHRRLQATGGPTAEASGTLVTTLIDGGTSVNTVPDLCTLRVGRRIGPGEDVDEVSADLVRICEGATDLPVTVTVLGSGPPLVGEADSPFVTSLAVLSGSSPATTAFNSNAPRYLNVAREIVVMGPGSIDQAHKPEEWVEVDQLVAMARVYSSLLGL